LSKGYESSLNFEIKFEPPVKNPVSSVSHLKNLKIYIFLKRVHVVRANHVKQGLNDVLGKQWYAGFSGSESRVELTYTVRKNSVVFSFRQQGEHGRKKDRNTIQEDEYV
jgi:hypothetical protein